MKRLAIVTTLLLLAGAAPAATAGKIFGDIKLDGKPVAEGLLVRIAMAPAAGGEKPAPAPAVLDSARTDKFGSYKLNVKGEGKCVLTLVHGKQPVSLEIFSYQEATRYDLILEMKEGKPALRRK